MKKINDKEFLEDLAKQVIDGLKENEDITPPFVFTMDISAFNSLTDGWYVQIGTLRGFGCSAQIWFDRFTNHADRKIYFGIRSSKFNDLHRVVSVSGQYLGTLIEFSKSQLAYTEDIVHLEQKLLPDNFEKPILERYKECYYGVYKHPPKGFNKKETKQLSSEIADFFISLNSALSLEILKNIKLPQGLENQKTLRQYLERKRYKFIATRRKQQDKYICQVCRFDFVKAYGEFGRSYAEAHHIVPLRKNDQPRITTIDDLITVCSNCHSMLDRMEGTTTDIERLKKIVRIRKA